MIRVTYLSFHLTYLCILIILIVSFDLSPSLLLSPFLSFSFSLSRAQN